ncbi:MAG: glucuronate isomerase, partial [Eubacteriales bacterium]|nr:glucuronate isomerase [Eubacteriales bacterium]
DMSARSIIKKSNVRLICTTDDPEDDLKSHEKLEADSTFDVTVLPTFRPENLMNPHKSEFLPYLMQLESVCGFKIDTMDKLRLALEKRMDYFDAHGCLVSDHALESFIYEEASEEELNKILSKARDGCTLDQMEIEKFQTAVLMIAAKEYHKRNWVMQLHFSRIRNNSQKMFSLLGADAGFDAIDDTPNARKLSLLLNALEKYDALPKTILYSLNPADNAIIASVMGCFQTDSGRGGRIQQGSAWWYNDNKLGIRKQMLDLANLGVLGSFVGMLTDSRSFLSYVRHEYFRRIMCDLIGELVENGEYPYDLDQLGTIVRNISFYNTKDYFGFYV